MTFEKKKGFPNCLGPVDGPHLKIRAPKGNVGAGDHKKFKDDYNVLLQAIVDSSASFSTVMLVCLDEIMTPEISCNPALTGLHRPGQCLD